MMAEILVTHNVTGVFGYMMAEIPVTYNVIVLGYDFSP